MGSEFFKKLADGVGKIFKKKNYPHYKNSIKDCVTKQFLLTTGTMSYLWADGNS